MSLSSGSRRLRLLLTGAFLPFAGTLPPPIPAAAQEAGVVVGVILDDWAGYAPSPDDAVRLRVVRWDG